MLREGAVEGLSKVWGGLTIAAAIMFFFFPPPGTSLVQGLLTLQSRVSGLVGHYLGIRSRTLFVQPPAMSLNCLNHA